LFVDNSSSNNISQYTIGAGGMLAPLNPAAIATGMFPVALAIDPGGRWLYSANTNSAEVGLFSIGSSGALAALNPPRVAIGTANVNNPSGIAVDPSGHYVYVTDSVDPTGMVWQFTIGMTGALTPMTPPSVPAGVVPQSIAIAAHYQ
jgi:DNA-binding beta-propeller fold protein YncE